MKKLMAWIVMLCMLSGVACGEELPRAAIELAQRIDKLADSSEYLDALFANDRLTDKVQEIAAGDRGEAYTMMVNVDLSTAVDSALAGMMIDMPIDDPMVREEVAKRLASALLIHAVAVLGADTLAVTNSVTSGALFATDAQEGSGIYLIFYGEHAPVAVFWTVSSGAASLSAMFVPIAELQACTEPQQVAEWFAGIGCEGAVVTPVE